MRAEFTEYYADSPDTPQQGLRADWSHAMTEQIDSFEAYRARMNERVLGLDNRVIKRVFSVDSLVYTTEGRLPRRTKEMLGLVASLVLRCDDCVRYHLLEGVRSGLDREELVEAMSIGLVVGGTIVIPHLRRAVEFLDEVIASEGSAAVD
jgi:AhpD family alkylhydroperoxidase